MHPVWPRRAGRHEVQCAGERRDWELGAIGARCARERSVRARTIDESNAKMSECEPEQRGSRVAPRVMIAIAAVTHGRSPGHHSQ